MAAKASVLQLQLQLAVTELFVDPLSDLWDVLLRELERSGQGEAPRILRKKITHQGTF